MMNKIKNFSNNYKRLGSQGVLEFYLKNIFFKEQIHLNTFLLIPYLIKDNYDFSKVYLKEKIKECLAFLGIIPKISVIMSVYNGHKYINESIESILTQNFKEFEFLIMDDASNDNSYYILERYAKTDKRIKLFRNKKNSGLTKSLNFLIKQARGLVIARMDSDDISLQGRLLKEYEFLKENRNTFLVGTRIYHIDSKGKILSNPVLPINSFEISEMLPIINCIYHPTIMFRNKGYKYREKFLYAQDYDFYLNLLSLGNNFYNLEKTLLSYRITKSSISGEKGNIQKQFAEKAKEFYFQRIEEGKDKYDGFVADFSS